MARSTPDPRSSVVRRLVALGVTLAVFGGLIYGAVQYFGGNNRSAATYCQMWVDEGKKLQKESNAAIQQAQQSGDLFAPLNFTVGSPRELADFFGRLDQVAPDEIEPAVSQLHDAMQQTADNLGDNATDPLAFLGAQFSVILTAGPAEQQVEMWNQTNCPSALPSPK